MVNAYQTFILSLFVESYRNRNSQNKFKMVDHIELQIYLAWDCHGLAVFFHWTESWSRACSWSWFGSNGLFPGLLVLFLVYIHWSWSWSSSALVGTIVVRSPDPSTSNDRGDPPHPQPDPYKISEAVITTSHLQSQQPDP